MNVNTNTNVCACLPSITPNTFSRKNNTDKFNLHDRTCFHLCSWNEMDFFVRGKQFMSLLAWWVFRWKSTSRVIEKAVLNLISHLSNNIHWCEIYLVIYRFPTQISASVQYDVLPYVLKVVMSLCVCVFCHCVCVCVCVCVCAN